MKQKLGEEKQELRHLRAYFGQLLSEKQTERSLLLIQGILESKSVNLWSCAESLGRSPEIVYTAEQLYSQYLDHFQTGNFDKLLKMYFLAVFYQTFPWSRGELVMDRTEWKLGKQWHNLLVIGYICHDSLVPLVWVDLGTRKSSSEGERIELLDRLRAWWRATGIPMPPLMLYADREFIGSNWFKALVQRDIQFVIRLKENQVFNVWRDGKISSKAYNIKVITRYLKRYKLSHIDIVIGDEVLIPFTYAEQVLDNQEIRNWYLAANIDQPHTAAQCYAFRWTIEDTFGHFKTKGLNLEDFNLEGQHKLEIMMGLVSIVYALCIHQALSENLVKNVPIKKNKKGVRYPAKATFKLGLEYIRKFVQNVNQLIELFLHIIDNIICVCKTRKFILKKSIVQ